VNGAVRRRGISDYLAGCVVAEGSALTTTQSTEVAHSPIGKQKCVITVRSGDISGPARCSLGIRSDGGAACASKRTEVIHSAASVQKRMVQTIGSLSRAGDQTGRIYRVGRARGSAERTQVENLVDKLGLNSRDRNGDEQYRSEAKEFRFHRRAG